MRHGQFEARETVHVCAVRCRHASGTLVTRRAASLSQQIIPGRTVGYDVMIFVGLERFLSYRQREEIQTALLREHGIPLSTGEISNLAKLFLDYLLELHNTHSGQLRAALAHDGGWPLHVDATGEHGRGTLLVTYAGWRRWVLGAWKISTERAELMLPCLRDIFRQFGAPSSVMRDLGHAVTSAVNELVDEFDLDIPVLACHLHFLADIGADLLDTTHGELRALFRLKKIRPKLRALVRDLGRKLGSDIGEARKEVRTWQEQTGMNDPMPQGRTGIATVRAIAQWVLDYQADSTGEDFPFDRPYLDFHDRCVVGRRAVDTFLSKHPEDRKVPRTLKRLQRILDSVVSDVSFRQLVLRLRKRAKLFDELRDALRLAPKPSCGRNKTARKNPPPSDQTATTLRDIRKEVEQLVTSLNDRRCRHGKKSDTRQAIDVILRHIEDHGDYLWGHEISLPLEIGGGIRLVERTNNLLETFFKGIKHNERRRSGRKILTQDLEHIPSAAALVHNLNCPDYVEIICGSMERLPQAFAQLDAEKRRRSLAGEQPLSRASTNEAPQLATASLPIEDRRLIRAESMHRRILSAANSRPVRVPTTPHSAMQPTPNDAVEYCIVGFWIISLGRELRIGIFPGGCGTSLIFDIGSS